MEAALSVEGTVEIPAVICYEGIFIRDHWSQLSSQPWWERLLPGIEQQMAWRSRVAAAIGQDWFQLPTAHSRDERLHLSIQEGDGRVYETDGRSRRQRQLDAPGIGGWPGRGIASIHPSHPPTTREGVDAWLASTGQYLPLADGRADLAHQILSDWGAMLYPLRHVTAPLWACYGMWGFEGMMTRIVDDPGLVHFAVQRFTDCAVEQARVSASLGARGIWIEDCMTDMISGEHFKALNLAYLRRLTDELRFLGLHSIHYFCGSPAGKWRLLLDTGADALALEESKKGFTIDIEDVAERTYGRMTILGNLDAVSVLEHASEAELRVEIGRQLRAGRRNRGRFIMSLGSPVTPDTPVSRVRLYCDLVHEMGSIR